MNNCTFIGYLGDDFLVDYTPQGKCYAKNSLAVSKRFTNAKGEVETKTTWIPIVIFGKAAEVVYLHFVKGSQFACNGELSTSQYIDKKTGATLTSFSIIVRTFDWLAGNKQVSKGSTTTPAASNQQAAAEPKKAENTKEAEEYDKFDIDETEVPF